MPRLTTPVLKNERAIERLQPDGVRRELRIKDAKNLVLRIGETGVKSFIFLYKAPSGQRRRITVGSFPETGLNQAKTKALEITVKVKAGFDPQPGEPLNGNTVADLTALFLVEVRREQSPTWAANVDAMLKKDVLPVIGRMQVDQVKRVDVAKLVDGVAARGSRRRADQTLSVVRSFYKWAVGRGRVDVEIDPTYKLTKHNGNKARKRKLTDAEIKTFWPALDDQKFSPQIRDALRLSLLTGARIGECVGAPRSEFNFVEMIWTIPEERTKSDREHILPLSPMAAEIVREAMERSGKSEFLFPARGRRAEPGYGEPVAVHSASQAMRRLCAKLGIEDVRTHDLRRTCASRLGDLGVDQGIVSRVLNHAPKSVTNIHYLHSHYIPAMRDALDKWAVQLQAIIAQVPKTVSP